MDVKMVATHNEKERNSKKTFNFCWSLQTLAAGLAITSFSLWQEPVGKTPMQQSHSARVYTTHVMSAGILHFILKMHCNILSVCTFLGSGVWRQVLIELDGPVTDPISHLYPRSPFIYATLYIHHTFIRAVYTSYIFICTTYILAAISIFLTGFAWMSVLFFNCLLTCSNWKRAKGQTQCQRISIFPTFLYTENTIYTLLVFYELWDLSHVKPVRWRNHRGEVLRSWLSRNSAALPSSVISELYRTSHILCGFCETDQNVKKRAIIEMLLKLVHLRQTPHPQQPPHPTCDQRYIMPSSPCLLTDTGRRPIY